MDWTDILRLLVVIGMAYGAWAAFKNLPPAALYQGKRYYRQADGSFRTLWGQKVRDPVILRGLERVAQGATSKA